MQIFVSAPIDNEATLQLARILVARKQQASKAGVIKTLLKAVFI